MEQWLEVTIRTASGGIDLLCAELTEAGFDSFVIDDSEQFRQFLDGARAYWDYVDEKLARADAQPVWRCACTCLRRLRRLSLQSCAPCSRSCPAAIRPVNSAR